MSARGTLIAGAAVIGAALTLLLLHDEGASTQGDAWPHLLEDTYDRQAYQQRGRWIASGGTPYIDEFSEYPQLTTWMMGLPYLFFDHDVKRGQPFGAKQRVEAIFARGGLEPGAADRLFKEMNRRPYGRARGRDDSPAAAWIAPLVRRTAQDEVEVRTALDDAWREIRAAQDEIKRNYPRYADLHHALMAIWYVALLAVLVLTLRTLEAPPTFALLSLLPASLYFGFNRFDLVVTTMVVTTFLLHFRARPTAAAFVLGLAVMTKWFPIVLAPLFFAHDYRRMRGEGSSVPTSLRRAVLVPGLALASVVAVVLTITYVWNGGGVEAVRFVFDWHKDVREPNRSSLLTTLTSPEQWAIVDGALRTRLELAFKVLQLLPGALLALLPLRRNDSFLLGCLAATLCMVIFSEFFSPQWIVWITALCAMIAPTPGPRPARRWLIGTVIVLEVLLYAQIVLHHHAFATNLLDGFQRVHYARTATMLALLAVTIALTLRAAWTERAPRLTRSDRSLPPARHQTDERDEQSAADD